MSKEVTEADIKAATEVTAAEVIGTRPMYLNSGRVVVKTSNSHLVLNMEEIQTWSLVISPLSLEINLRGGRQHVLTQLAQVESAYKQLCANDEQTPIAISLQPVAPRVSTDRRAPVRPGVPPHLSAAIDQANIDQRAADPMRADR